MTNPAMKRDDAVRAYAAYNRGKEIKALAKEYGVTYRVMYDAINRMRHNDGINPQRQRTLDLVIYPGLRKYMRDHDIQYKELGEWLGLTKGGVRDIAVGTHPLKPKYIKALRALTGMTYEQIVEGE